MLRATATENKQEENNVCVCVWVGWGQRGLEACQHQR